jgi:phage terminase large subunit
MLAQFPDKLKPLFQPARYKVAYGGRGAAKSWGYARALLIQAAQQKLRILCTREIQKSIKDSVHKLLEDQIEALGLGGFFTVLQNEIRGVNGSEFMFAGLSQLTVESIKSYEGVDRVWVEEGHAVTKRSWSVLIPTIRKAGSEIWISFNPELDSDETYQRFVVNTPPDTVLMPMNWRDNPWFSDLLGKERDHLQKTDPDEYENVWEGKPRSVVAGAIYRHEIQALLEAHRVRAVPYDPLLKVHTVWDLGWNDLMTVSLVQRLGSEVRVIEYLEDSHVTYASLVSDLEKKRYRWGKDYIPHDGKAKNAQTGKSAEETLRALGRSVEIVPDIGVEQGIKAARMLFPRVYVDKDKASGIVNRLKRYRRGINQQTNEPGEPVHDENSHGADNFRYLAVVADRMNNESWSNKPIKYPNMGVV